ncbi:MAG: adenylate/guanylate cyclase domain-containing protein [Pseudomonadota bacterium]
MNKKTFKRFFKLLLLIVIVLMITFGLSFFKSVNDLENYTYDLRQISFAPETKISPDIVMVWLDEATMSKLPYRTPIPRDFLATLHEKIWSASPKLIAYDIFFKDSSFSKDDEMLAQAFAGTNVYSVVPVRREGCEIFDKFGTTERKEMKEDLYGCVDTPLPLFMNVLKGIGLADLPFNAFDQVVRKATFEFNTDRGRTLSLAALLFESLTNKKVNDVVPVRAFDKHHRVFIRFAGPPTVVGEKGSPFKVFSAALVAKGLIPQGWLKDKIVLVGASYSDLKDAFLTPYYSSTHKFAKMNGVEIHANILNDLLNGQFYDLISPVIEYAFIILIVILLGVASLFISPWKTTFTTLFVAIGIFAIAIFAINKFAIITPVITPVIAAMLAAGLGMVLRALTEGREKRFIKGVFSRYVPPAVVDRMVGNPALLTLGGEQRMVSSLFSDIASFTSISEKFEPKILVQFLNEYLGLMNEVLFKYGATLDKYEGDAIIAFFNAPLDLEHHEKKSTMCALEMQKASLKISEIWKERAGREIRTRIGVNTGPAVVGNMGSQGRFDYTAIGDTINLASRLEGINKFYSTYLMISEVTAKALDDSIVVRPVDRVRVKGKKEPILIFEALGEANEIPSEIKDALLPNYMKAFEGFEKRKFRETIDILVDLIKKFPDDGPSLSLIERCKRGLEAPDMELVTNMESK